jgi:mono/diheme cytochrome c family protein
MSIFKLSKVAAASVACLLALSTQTVLAAGNGQQLYQKNCASCHGANGLGQMKGVPNLASFDVFSKPDQPLIEVIRSGRNTMPSFLGILNDREIRDVISYVRTLR